MHVTFPFPIPVAGPRGSSHLFPDTELEAYKAAKIAEATGGDPVAAAETVRRRRAGQPETFSTTSRVAEAFNWSSKTVLRRAAESRAALAASKTGEAA